MGPVYDQGVEASDHVQYAITVATAFETLKRTQKLTVEDLLDETGLSRSTFYRVINQPEKTSPDAVDALAVALIRRGADIEPRTPIPFSSPIHRRWCEVGERICKEFPDDADTLLDNIEEILRAKILLRDSIKKLADL